MTARRFAAFVFIGVSFVQIAWIAVLPPFRGIDEVDHAFRASAVAHGQWMPGAYAEDGRGRLVKVPAALAAAAGPQCWSLPYTGLDNCFPVSDPHAGMVRIASSAANYNPPFYWLVGSVARPFSGVVALYAMRAATALICALLLGAAAWCLGLKRSGPWRGIGLMLAMSPIALYSTTVVAPNGPEIAAGVMLWSALLALSRVGTHEGESRLLWVAGLGAILLGNLRTLGPGFLVISLVLWIVLARSQARRIMSAHRRTITTIGVLTLLSIAEQLWWIRHSSGGHPLPQDGTSRWEWSDPMTWQLTTIAAFPFRNQPAPVFVYPLFGAILICFWVLAYRRSSRNIRLVLTVLTVGVLSMPFILTALTYSGRGVIWQGRYGLPLAVGVPLLGGFSLDTWKPPIERILVAAIAASFVLISVASLLHVRAQELRRSVSVSGAWHTPSIALVTGLVVVGWAFWAWPLLRRKPLDG